MKFFFAFLAIIATVAALCSASSARADQIAPIVVADSIDLPPPRLPQTIPGAWLSASSSFLKVMGPLINNLITKFALNYTIPDVDSSHIKITHIKLLSLDCTDCVHISLSDGKMQLLISGASATAALDYEAHLSILHSTGSCKPVLQSLSVSADIAFAAPVDGKPQLVLAFQKFHVDKLSLHCTGAAGHVASLLTTLVTHMMGGVFDHLLSKIVTRELNKELQKISLRFKFLNLVSIDYSLVPSASYIGSDDVRLGVKGVVTPLSAPGLIFPFNPPARLDFSCSKSHMVGVGISLYSLDTGAYSFFVIKKLATSIPNLIKASTVSLLIPGFEKKLGGSARLNFTLGVSGSPAWSTNVDKHALSVAFPVNLTLSGAEGTHFVLGSEAAAGVSVTVKDNKLYFAITEMTFSDAKIISTNVGGSALVAVILTLFNSLVSRALLYPINAFAARHGFPLPAFDGFASYDQVIVYNPNSICVASNLRPT